MRALIHMIENAVRAEYSQASAMFGSKNNSLHESYGIIKEEFEEAKNECSAFDSWFNSFWDMIKSNNQSDIPQTLKNMQTCAELAAAEWIQVAAMCYKAKLSMEDGGDADT